MVRPRQGRRRRFRRRLRGRNLTNGSSGPRQLSTSSTAPGRTWPNILHHRRLQPGQGVEFRRNNGDREVGFGYNTISATGDLKDQPLRAAGERKGKRRGAQPADRRAGGQRQLECRGSADGAERAKHGRGTSTADRPRRRACEEGGETSRKSLERTASYCHGSRTKRTFTT